MISLLLGVIVRGRRQVHFVGLTLHQHAQQMWSLVLHSLTASSQIQRWSGWSNGIKMLAGVRTVKLGEDIQGTVMEFMPDVERQSRSPDMGKVVVRSAARPRPIRDGPMRRQQRRAQLLHDDECKAA